MLSLPPLSYKKEESVDTQDYVGVELLGGKFVYYAELRREGINLGRTAVRAVASLNLGPERSAIVLEEVAHKIREAVKVLRSGRVR